MNGKITLYIGLLIIGLAAVGAGLWFVFNPSSAAVIEVPDEEPVIFMENTYAMAGENNQLFLYEDGTVIYFKEEGLRPAMMNVTRTWMTGKISSEELRQLIYFFKSVRFSEMDAYYQSPTMSQESGSTSDLRCSISINSDNLSNSVTTCGYFPPDSSLPYPKLLYPLDEIYTKLLDIIESKTGEIYSEIIER